jgi:hypothetical protein
MKVIYRTKLTPDEIFTRLSENTEEEGFFFNKRNVLTGDTKEERDTFEINKLLSSVHTTVRIRGTITKIDGSSLIEVQIYTDSNRSSFIDFIYFSALFGMLGFIINNWNGVDKSYFVGLGAILFIFWVSNLREVDDASDIIKRELKEIFDAEMEEI